MQGMRRDFRLQRVQRHEYRRAERRQRPLIALNLLALLRLLLTSARGRLPLISPWPQNLLPRIWDRRQRRSSPRCPSTVDVRGNKPAILVPRLHARKSAAVPDSRRLRRLRKALPRCKPRPLPEFFPPDLPRWPVGMTLQDRESVYRRWRDNLPASAWKSWRVRFAATPPNSACYATRRSAGAQS